MWALFFLTVSTNASFKLFLCFSCYHVSTNSIALSFSLWTSHNPQFLNLLCRRVNINTWAFSVKNVFLWPSLPLKNFFLHHSILLPLFQNWQSSFHLTRWEKTSSLPSSWLRTLGPLRHEQTVEWDWGENYKETNDMLQKSKSTFKGGMHIKRISRRDWSKYWFKAQKRKLGNETSRKEVFLQLSFQIVAIPACS